MYPNQAAVMTYGRAFGDNSKGLVVYLAGHDFDHGTEVANVAAARIFGNFLLYSSILYSPVINSVMIPTTANAGEQINLSVSVSQSYSPIVYYEWSSNLNGVFTNQSLSTIFIPPNVDTPTICTVQIKVIDECGREGLYHANILILPKNDPCLKVDPAKIFTPNNDGLYDKWVAFKSNCISKVEAFVYNRWGGLVYHSENYNNNWDGTYKNKPLPDATYYYVLNIVENSGLRYTKKGSITIMR
jgi:gliding motility-associated-like protein